MLEKRKKHRRTKVKKTQPALGQATKTPFQPGGGRLFVMHAKYAGCTPQNAKYTAARQVR
jgi:hypothetical protein